MTSTDSQPEGDSETPSIDLDGVLEILAEAGGMALKLNGGAAEGEGRAFRASEANLSRTLLNMADQLALASNLVRNEYWNMKGMPSYEL